MKKIPTGAALFPHCSFLLLPQPILAKGGGRVALWKYFNVFQIFEENIKYLNYLKEISNTRKQIFIKFARHVSNTGEAVIQPSETQYRFLYLSSLSNIAFSIWALCENIGYSIWASYICSSLILSPFSNIFEFLIWFNVVFNNAQWQNIDGTDNICEEFNLEAVAQVDSTVAEVSLKTFSSNNEQCLSQTDKFSTNTSLESTMYANCRNTCIIFVVVGECFFQRTSWPR